MICCNTFGNSSSPFDWVTLTALTISRVNDRAWLLAGYSIQLLNLVLEQLETFENRTFILVGCKKRFTLVRSTQ